MHRPAHPRPRPGGEGGPQTPLVSGRGPHRALKGSWMVFTQGGEGHGAHLSFDGSCANAPVNDDLAVGRLPAQDVTCRATPGGAERRAEIAPAVAAALPGPHRREALPRDPRDRGGVRLPLPGR
ncbi:alpha/beta hydrolase [Streptomyces sp. NPDC050448]|uniref:alpha/beta hydrolase n=1 Tax=Streptomyces sp. NPDC050448 TaxID=3155404 RepID=UPI00343DA5D5